MSDQNGVLTIGSGEYQIQRSGKDSTGALVFSMQGAHHDPYSVSQGGSPRLVA